MSEKPWTDEELRTAVRSSTTYRAVMRKLGFANGSLNHLKKQIDRIQESTAHFDRHPKNNLCGDDELRELVRTSTTGTEVLAKLGMEPRRAHFTKLNRRIDMLKLDTSHFVRRRRLGPERRGTRWSDEDLRSAVASSTSVAQTIRKLGLVPAGGNYDQIQRRIKTLQVDTSHFTGQGWNVGGKVVPARMPLEEILVADRWCTSHHLKKRLFRAGLKEPRCELCSWSEMSADGRIPVELDHINGDRNDNRLENLRVLCPNCHSLQPTHRGLNQKRARRATS